MLKIKIFAVVFILGLVGIVLNGSHHFSVSANDVADEIANYKNWTRITKEPIKAEFTIDNLSGGG
jgi:hypothetical protein